MLKLTNSCSGPSINQKIAQSVRLDTGSFRLASLLDVNTSHIGTRFLVSESGSGAGCLPQPWPGLTSHLWPSAITEEVYVPITPRQERLCYRGCRLLLTLGRCSRQSWSCRVFITCSSELPAPCTTHLSVHVKRLLLCCSGQSLSQLSQGHE